MADSMILYLSVYYNKVKYLTKYIVVRVHKVMWACGFEKLKGLSKMHKELECLCEHKHTFRESQ